MEKQGMDCGKRLYRTGLLIFIAVLFFFPSVFVFAQDGESAGPEPAGVIEVRTELSSVNAMVNSPWSVFIMVNHPNPREVDVKTPRFPPSLILDRVRTETRFIRRVQAPGEAAPGDSAGGADAVQGDRWTRVEFLFTPVRAGMVSIMPFEITVLNQRYETGNITLRIREEAVRRSYDPRLRWQSQAPFASGAAAAGEKFELQLDLTNWDPSKDVPRGIFQGRAPRNAILEEGLPEAVGTGTYRYSISIIPLEGNIVALESFLFRADVYTLTVPAISFPVLSTAAGSQLAGGNAPGSNLLENNLSDGSAADAETNSMILGGAIPFPENQEKRVPFFNREYRRICSRVQTLWDEGRRAEALAEIRRNERDSPAGRYLVSLRSGMEQALGLGYTEDEKWFPMKASLFIWAIVGFMVIFSVSMLMLFRPDLLRKGKARKNVTSRRRFGFKAVIVFSFFLGLALIFLGEGIGNIPTGWTRSPGKAAVLRETLAYRVPDAKGAVNARFGEGQPVIVSDSGLDWCSAESPDGRYGWVPREAVINY